MNDKTREREKMLDIEKPIQGVSVYAEFAKPGYRTELFITPDGFSNEGKVVPAKIFSRITSADKPKKVWQQYTVQLAEDMAKVGETPLDETMREDYVAKRLAHLENVFVGLIANEWQIVKEPVLIETSKNDLSEIAESKTPVKIIYRINQSRKALGFPDTW
jgi:hypothetical protein